MAYFVYILYSENLKRFYSGQTGDLRSRLIRHNNGYERFTSKGIPWKLVFFEQVASRAEAMSIEKKIKNLKSQERIKVFIEKEIADGRGCRGNENL